MGFSYARVTEVVDVNERLRRVRFEVPDLPDLGLPGQPDEAVGIYFPRPGEQTVPPMQFRNGAWAHHDVTPAPEGRNYSVRRVDHHTRSMSVDFVVHSRGPATLWAQHAAPGAQVVMAHARGWYRPPVATAWELLVADLAGLPALARIVEEHPAPERLRAVVEVVSDDDLDYIDDHFGIDVTALVGSGNGTGPSRLGDAVADIELPAENGYCWFGAEAAQSRAVRKHLRHHHRWGRDAYDIIGYWRFDGELWGRRYAEHGEELFAVYQGAIAAGKTEKEAAEEFDEALERAGL
ncbi:siderophore-interacting protein [Gordonia sp. CPCC 206044]|uniref:siderophore-interacting protein n=1 Tax=Gordonia sp. CPCC 206044 TaxID=3140793 RepID=UPI003AF3A9C5